MYGELLLPTIQEERRRDLERARLSRLAADALRCCTTARVSLVSRLRRTAQAAAGRLGLAT